ncbi:MAG: thioesterase family protein [Idiomarina sp.]|nr:thioesterase family protein [Idiomarina sp.]
MSLLGRLAWILIKRAREPQCEPFDTLRVRSRVLPHDLDLNFHVNNGRYLTFADLGRMDWFIRTGCFQVARKQGCIPVIGDVTARYVKQLKAFDRFYIESRLLGWNHKWAYLEHRILNENDQLAALVVVRGMFWSKRSGGIAPAELIAATGHEGSESPELPDWVQRWAETLEALSGR